MIQIAVRETLDRRSARRTSRWLIICIIALAFGSTVWGIRKNLPYSPEVDEPIYVTRAIHIAASGDLNPAWFGNPASTTIYPLAVLYHLWFAGTQHGRLVHADPVLQARFDAEPADYYFLGRLLTIAYALSSVALTYRLGMDVFDERVALLGSLLLTLSPLWVTFAQLVRTDTAATFYGLLGLWLCLKLFRAPTLVNALLTGGTIGLAIASRYFMIALVPVHVAASLPGLFGSILQRQYRPRWWVGAIIGLLAMVVTFAFSTPFFFLDFSTAVHDIQIEARSTHLGADGLSPLGNLWWYVAVALPDAVGWPALVLAFLGMLLVVRQRDSSRLLLLGFAVVFLGGTVISPLHWARWMIQLLPLLALFSAFGLATILDATWTSVRFRGMLRPAITPALIALVAVWPLYHLAVLDLSQSGPTTQVKAREWLIQHLPAHSKIAQEWYCAPLSDTNFDVSETNSLATDPRFRTFADYRQAGFQYLIVSDYMYGRFFAERERYPSEIAFYQGLFDHGRLIQAFSPSLTSSGPVIQIYALSP